MTAAPDTCLVALRIAQSHPSLPGHFPGNPIVPGVVLLDHVLQAAQSWLGTPVTLQSLSQVKFMQPLLPEQDAQIELTLQATQLRFSVRRDSQLLAQGIMQIDTGTLP